MSRNITPLLYGSQVYVTYKTQSFLGWLFGSNVTEVLLCSIEMYGRKQNRLSEQTERVVLKPLDKNYSEITVFLSDVKKDILKRNPEYFIYNS
jgi:hypothetical protein